MAEPFEAALRPDIGVAELIGVAAVYALLLGWAFWTDLFRGRTIRDTASLGLVFVSAATLPLLWAEPRVHLLWAFAISAFVFLSWLAGAFADGDLKIYLAYALLLGPLAIPVILLSWILILLYSLPTIVRSLRSGEKQPRGERLGTAAGAPGIVLSLPLGLLPFGLEPVQAALWTGAMFAVVGLSALIARLDRKIFEAHGDNE